MGCVNCGRGFWQLCKDGRKLGHSCLQQKTEPKELTMENLNEHISGNSTSGDVLPKSNKHGGSAASLRDPKSTGRKRAAKLYPIDASLNCEWSGKKNCGGGLVPIIGCNGNTQVHRHHGPVKDTTRNHLGNVHRICTRCHNHWHELNDLLYDEAKYALLPHDPMPASLEEILNEEVAWATGEKAAQFQLASSVKSRKDYSHEEE